MGLTRAARARLWLMAAVTAPAVLAGCSSSAPTASGVDDCPPFPVWDRNVTPPGADDMVLMPEATAEMISGIGDTADQAVQSLATGIGVPITVQATRPVGPTAVPGDELELDVVDDQGRSGAYLLAEIAGVWMVSGGDGCGAPPPADLAQGTLACPTPTFPSNAPDDYTAQVQ